MATYAQLKKQIEQLAKQAEAALRAEKDVVLAKVREAVSSFSLSVEEVFGGSGKKKAKNAKPAVAKRVPKGAGQAKYADPKTGATWSGFGRAPAWIASARDRTKFLVSQPVVAAVSTQPKAVKPAKPKAAVKTTKTPATKKAVKTPTPAVAAPVKKAAQAAPRAKAVAPAKKAAPVAPKKAVSKKSAPARKAVAPKAKTPAPQAPANVLAKPATQA